MATITEPDYCPLSVVHEFLDDLWPFIFNNYTGKDLLILLDAYQKTSQSGLKSLMGNMQAGRQGGQQGKGKQQGKGIPIGGKRPQGNQQPAGMRAMKKKSMKKRSW